MACASTEPGDSSALSRTGESSEFGEVFDQAEFLRAAFGTPGQQASLGDLHELQAGIQAEQARTRKAADATGARVEQLAEDVLGITSQIATLTTAVTALVATVVRLCVAHS